MGYETKLLIGASSSHTTDECVYGDLVIEDGEAGRPIKKNEKGEFLTTGRKETFFHIMATIDLCKCGGLSKISAIDGENKDEFHLWYWYSGNERITEDLYGVKPRPVPIADVVAALKKDVKDDPYRRFKWALALLESMVGDKEDEISVLLYGH